MAWNEPGNRGEPPRGKKRAAGQSGGGLDATLKNLQQRLQAALGGSSTPPDGSSTGEPSGRLIWMVGALVLLLWLATGIYQIDASNKGVIQRFGRYNSVRGEGIAVRFPWPIEKLTKVNVSAVNSVEEQSKMLTLDVNLVEIRAAIQFQKADPVKVLFQVRDVEQTLAEVSESAIREIVGQATLENVLGAGRQQISESARDLIQRTLDSYNTGLRIISVNLTNVQVPQEVAPAQQDANRAIEDKQRLGTAAQAYAADILPKADGDAQRLVQDAEAYKAQVVSLAEGDVSRFNSVYSVYAQAPEVTRQRMYIEAIEQMMYRSNKIILDTSSGSGNNMIYLPLDKLLERNAASRTPAAAPAAAPAEEMPGVTIDGRSRGTR